MPGRGTVLVTGVGRRIGIGAGIATGLAADGFDLILNHWAPYDDRLGLPRGAHDAEDIAETCRAHGVRVTVVSDDLADPNAPRRLVDAAASLGPIRGIVASHCESVDSHALDTTVESWDRHFAVNARAIANLVRFLFSDAGGWINGQLLYADGGFHAAS